MKERPILFSGPMVRALLAGTKTQTRRILQVQDEQLTLVNDGGVLRAVAVGVGEGARWLPFKYGQPGDHLWVREDHHVTLLDPRAVSVRYLADDSFVAEVTIGAREHSLFLGRKRPLATTRARFMWRCVSRITLEVLGVRVERLNDISEADAIAEGIKPVAFGLNDSGFEWSPTEDATDNAVQAYARLWESINGLGSWAANPWVWVIEFRRVAG